MWLRLKVKASSALYNNEQEKNNKIWRVEKYVEQKLKNFYFKKRVFIEYFSTLLNIFLLHHCEVFLFKVEIFMLKNNFSGKIFFEILNETRIIKHRLLRLPIYDLQCQRWLL